MFSQILCLNAVEDYPSCVNVSRRWVGGEVAIILNRSAG